MNMTMKNFSINAAAVLLVIVINTLANWIPINGKTTGEISSQLQVLFTPAGYVFGIWGLIYVLLALWVLAQWPESRRKAPVYQACSELFWLSSVLNVAWLFSWHYQLFLLSNLLMIGLVITLIFLYQKAKKAHASWLETAPFSIYLGWISVATIANISYYLVYLGLGDNETANTFWAIFMIFVASALALLFLARERDVLYTLVFVWAFIGIGVKNSEAHISVAAAAWISAAILLLAAIVFVIQIKPWNKLLQAEK